MTTSRFSRIRFCFRALAAFCSLAIFATQSPLYAFFAVSQPFALREMSSAQISKSSEILANHLERQILQQALAPIDQSTAIHAGNFSGFSPYAFYFTQHHAPAIRIFKADGSYRAFEINAQGKMGRVIEVGKFFKGLFSRTRVYDYDHEVLTVYHPTDAYQQKIYEINKAGEVGRPIQFRGRDASGNLVHVRFIYNDAEKTVTCLHLRGMHYAVYELLNRTVPGRLLEIGTALGIKNDGRLISLHAVEITSIQRWGNEVPVYKFRVAGTDGFILRERLAEKDNPLGVVGRVLRYVSRSGDLEYFYDDSRLNPKPSVTILDRLHGGSVRIEIPRIVLDETHGRVDRQSLQRNSELSVAADGAKHFFILTHAAKSLRALQGGIVFTFLDRLIIQEIWGNLLRGPPFEGVSL